MSSFKRRLMMAQSLDFTNYDLEIPNITVGSGGGSFLRVDVNNVNVGTFTHAKGVTINVKKNDILKIIRTGYSFSGEQYIILNGYKLNCNFNAGVEITIDKIYTIDKVYTETCFMGP